MLAQRVAARYLIARQIQGKALAKVWVVHDPTPNSMMADIMYETTPHDLVNYAVGTGSARWQAENTSLHDNKTSALADARARMSAMISLQRSR